MAHLQAALLLVSALGASPDSVTRSTGALQAGVASSPVELTLYVSVESTEQRELVASLYREVAGGRLEGKVRLTIRPVVRRDADGAAARAIHAAAAQGMLWPYLLRLCGEGGPPRECDLRRVADLAGLDGDAFDLALQSPEVAVAVERLRSECARDGVTATPSAFVDGRKLEGGLGCDALVAALAH
jgi:predicted DsbA family dithiol-disulfide isomerase